jgi:thiamine-phosphate pyrophosphorylase
LSLPKLYAILDVDSTNARGLDPLTVAKAWLDAGVRLIQLRSKTLETGALLELADELVAAARAVDALAVINDRVDVARMSGAAGVHLGQEDLSPAAARALLGERAVVGLSTHTGEQVSEACGEPITYLAIGPVFATPTKSQPYEPVGLDGVRHAAAVARTHELPVVAIGGITLETAPQVLAAGADSVAVISDLLRGDPAGRVSAYLRTLGSGLP